MTYSYAHLPSSVPPSTTHRQQPSHMRMTSRPLPSLQQQADQVVAFAQIFEHDLATSKFRAYEFPYHKTHPKQPTTEPLAITIQGKSIQLRQKGTLTYLGSQYDLDPADQTQHNHHLLQLDRHLYAVRHRPAPTSSKIYVLQHALIPDSPTPANSSRPHLNNLKSLTSVSSNGADNSSASHPHSLPPSSPAPI